MSARELDARLDALAALLGGYIAGAYRAGEIDRDQALALFKSSSYHADGLQRIVRQLAQLNGAVRPVDLFGFIDEEKNAAIDLPRRPR